MNVESTIQKQIEFIQKNKSMSILEMANELNIPMWQVKQLMGSSEYYKRILGRINTELPISEETFTGITSHLESKVPFILYYDKENYMRCYPAQLRIRCYANGELSTEEAFNGAEQFIDRIKLGLAAYDKFFSLEDEAPRKLTTGEVKQIEAPEEEQIEYEEDNLG